MNQLTEHVSMKEYACKHCGKVPPEFDTNPLYGMLFDIFEDIRRRWGKPIVINSGYRCPEHPETKKKPYSVHVFGLALDLGCKSAAEAKRMYQIINDNYPALRIGYKQYKKEGTNIIHIDIGFHINPKLLPEYTQGARW